MTAANGHDPALAEHVARALGAAVASGSGWTCRCPCHEDGTASLSVSTGDKQPLLVHCHAGCDGKAVLAEIGRRGLTPEREREPAKPRDKLEGIHYFHNALGEITFRVHRWRRPDGSKVMPQSRPDGKGGWTKGTGGAHKGALYHLPQLLAAPPDEPVVVVEGEAKVEALEKLGVLATCNAGGAGKWTREHARQLGGHPVIVLPDNDPQGHAHAALILATLPHARTVQLPGLPHKGDILDWLKAGGTPEQLRTLLLEGPPVALTRAAASDRAPATDAAARSRAPAREDWTGQLRRRGKNDECERNDFNILLALRHAPELRGRFRLNTFSENVEAADLPWCKGRDWGPWDETDDNLMAEWLQGNDLDVRPGQCGGNVAAVARANPFHPVRQHLDGLAWDGVERLSSWLVTYLGAKDAPSEYLEAVGRAWLISAIARVMRPGCQADHILILEGPQGGKKSSALRTLVGNDDWFTDEVATLGTKDYAQDLRGKLVIELSELSAMGRAEIERVKAAASRRVDHYRPSYGRYSKDFPRQCVLAGTTNSASYLLDDTGNRRFWCVMTGAIDLDALARARPQLWAEAYHAFKAGERWHLEPELEKAAAAEQAKRREEEPWTQEVLAYAVGVEKVYIADVLKHSALNIQDASRRDKPSAKRVAAILRSNGYVKRHGEKGNFWTLVQPEPTPPTVQPLGSGKNPSVSTTLNPLNPLNHTNDTYTHAHTRAHYARDHARMYMSGEMGSDGSVGSECLETKDNCLTPTVQPEPKPTVQPPWTDWIAWHRASAAGDPAHKRTVLVEWLAAAGGALDARGKAWLPKGLPDGDARECLLATLASISIETKER